MLSLEIYIIYWPIIVSFFFRVLLVILLLIFKGILIFLFVMSFIYTCLAALDMLDIFKRDFPLGIWLVRTRRYYYIRLKYSLKGVDFHGFLHTIVHDPIAAFENDDLMYRFEKLRETHNNLMLSVCERNVVNVLISESDYRLMVQKLHIMFFLAREYKASAYPFNGDWGSGVFLIGGARLVHFRFIVVRRFDIDLLIGRLWDPRVPNRVWKLRENYHKILVICCDVRATNAPIFRAVLRYLNFERVYFKFFDEHRHRRTFKSIEGILQHFYE